MTTKEALDARERELDAREAVIKKAGLEQEEALRGRLEEIEAREAAAEDRDGKQLATARQLKAQAIGLDMVAP